MKKNKTVTQKTKTKTAASFKPAIKAPANITVFVAIGIFLLTTLIFFWNVIFGKAFFWDDFSRYVYPVQSFAAKMFSAGAIPFWNPFSFCGMPFLADIQTGFFYLPNRLLSLFLDANGFLSVGALQLLIILHFIISQVNFFILSKYLKISSIGATIGAISYSFSMFMVCHVFHPMMIYHLAWLPLVLLFFLKGLDAKSYKFSIISGLIFGAVMLSGHPQTTLYIGFFLGSLFLWLFVAGIKAKEIKGSETVQYIFRGLAPFAIAAGIFSIQYLPSSELAGLSDRDENVYKSAGAGFIADMKYEKATEGSLKFKQAFSAISPKLFGYVDGSGKSKAPFYLTFKFVEVAGTGETDAPYNLSVRETNQSHFFWETAFYFGLTALIIGLIGAAVVYKTRFGLFLIVITAISFLFALGEDSYLYDLFYALPLFGTFRNPARMTMFITLAFSLLAGFGFDALWKRAGDKKILTYIIAFAGIVIFLTVLAATGILQGMLGAPEQMINELKQYGLIALITANVIAIIAALMNRGVMTATAAGIVLIFVAYIDLYIAGASFNENPQNPLETYKINDELRALLTPKPPDEIFRVNMRKYRPRIAGVMEDNQGMIDNIMLVEGYNPLRLHRRRPPMPRTDDYVAADRKFFDFFSVKYEIGIDTLRMAPAFFERNDYHPIIYAVRNVHIIPSDKIEAEMLRNHYDFKKEVTLEEQPDLKLLPSGDSLSGDTFKCINYSPNEQTYQIKLSSNAIVVFSEIWYPAWKTYLNGQQIKTLRANYCLRAAAVPAGEHKLELRYESDTFITGARISVATLVLSLVGLFLSNFLEKRKTKTSIVENNS